MIAGFSVMSGLLIIVSVYAILYTNRMQRNSTRILVENVTSLKYAEELEIALLDMKGLMAYYLLDGNNKWLDIFDQKRTAFLHWFGLSQQKANVNEELELLGRIENTFQQYLNYKIQVESLYQSGHKNRAREILTENLRETFNTIYDLCEDLLLLNEKLMNRTSQSITDDNRLINRFMVGVGIVGIVVGLAIGMILARSILHPIYELVLKVKGAAGEEIIEKIDVSEASEIDHLSRFVIELVDKVKQANENLEQSRNLLVRSERLASLGRMSAGLAHEIRNPLTAIKMLIFSLQKAIARDSRRDQDFQVIIDEIGRIENLLQAFLDFARPPEPNFTDVHMNDLVQRTIQLLEPQFRAQRIHFTQRYEADDLIAWGDEEQLKMVFVNIILNAMQSMKDGGRVTIRTSEVQSPDRANPLLLVSIADTGPGIPVEILDSVFDPFVTTKESGIGLGLSISYQIIRNHHGWIVAKNNPKKGAIFLDFLPQKKVGIS
jgi:signal transduction histidine kinase